MTVARENRQARSQPPDPRMLRIDSELIYEALDRQRRRRNMRYREVAQELGVAPPTVTGWGHGVGFSADHLARALAWLDLPLAGFVTPEPAEPRLPVPDAA
jgi:transcriptional regulator with XRE-family HTH domain